MPRDDQQQPQPLPPDPEEDLLTNRGLPSNVDAEQALLGAIIYDPSFYELAAMLGAEEFYSSVHQHIWNSMQRVLAAGLTIDRIAIIEDLTKHNGGKSPVEFSRIADLDTGLPAVLGEANVQTYVDMIREKARARRLINESNKAIHRALQGDYSEDISRQLVNSVQSLPDLGTGGLQSLKEFVLEFPGGLESFLDPTKRPKGLRTGFVKFDEMTGGLRDGELVIIAARPSMGKTALGMDIARAVSMHPTDPQPVAVFSLEMSKESLFTRMLCGAARVDLLKYRLAFMNAEERGRISLTMNAMLEAPLLLDDSGGLTVGDIHARARKMQREQGLGLVVVDYLQLMAGKGKQENRQQEVSTISRGLKLAAKDLKVPFLVLSQLSRNPETRPGDHRPQLNDLRESGAIEQDADLVGFIYREEVYNRDREDLKGIATLIIGKQRNGPIGDIKLVFLKEFTRFENPIDLFDEPQASQ